jgi:2-(1,2-epoxy-1,2-dihydrophenyl)acetyl-CoA isomerase
MSYENILYEYRDGVARLTLNRPQRLNALCAPMFDELQDGLDDATARADLRVIVLTGAGRGFCAGADLAMPIAGSSDATEVDLGEALERYYNPLITRLRELPVPVVSAVNGVAAGAGASLALAADLCIAARSARFVLAFARIGLVPDAGLTYFLPQRIGLARALGLSLLGEEVSGEAAREWGLVWQCVDDDKLASSLEELVTRLARAPTRALGLTKRALYAATSSALAEQLSLERDLQGQAGRTRDFGEGVAAFLSKRAANFEGR